MSTPRDNNRTLINNFANKMSEFSKKLRGATQENQNVVDAIDKEVVELKTTATNLYSLLETTLNTLKNSIKELEKKGVPTTSLESQVKILEGLLGELERHLSVISGTNNTNKNIKSNISAIKENLKKQEELLKSNASGKPSSGIAETVFGDISETMFGGRKMRHTRRNKHKLNKTIKKHNKKHNKKNNKKH